MSVCTSDFSVIILNVYGTLIPLLQSSQTIVTIRKSCNNLVFIFSTHMSFGTESVKKHAFLRPKRTTLNAFCCTAQCQIRRALFFAHSWIRNILTARFFFKQLIQHRQMRLFQSLDRANIFYKTSKFNIVDIQFISKEYLCCLRMLVNM